ncbi:MAG: tetrahydrofolate dehydrogenase/cyclohydrolase catalytic domain-containing protein [Rikenellaceae bacterium]
MVLINGKEVAEKLKNEIAAEVNEIIEAGGKRPKLIAILVGSDGASQTYVGNKERMCAQVGFESEILRLDSEISEAELLVEIKKLNEDDTVDGFIVQLPLPKHINEQTIIEAIDPRKDVDGFHPENVGKMVIGLDTFVSATPMGIVELLRHYNVETSGKHCVVVGRSNIVGRPIANLLSMKGYPGDATVTICHSRTKNLKEVCQSADILIAALGIAEFVTADMVKEGATVIDVGITRLADESSPKGYRIAGDVKFDEVAPKCSFITPVPGGVGPMTIISLMKNTLKAGKKR